MPFHPTVTGHKGYSVILGKGAGQANIEYKLRELGMEIPSDDKISQLLTAIKKEALIRKWEVPDEALQYIIEKIIRAK
jgi:isopropylmalate/homocitrate/citramalate synthase